MLESLFSGLLSLLVGTAEVPPLKAMNLKPWTEEFWQESMAITQPAPDANAEAAVKSHIATMNQIGMAAARQGVWIQVGNEVLASHQGTVPLSAASLTKIPTTLAALVTWKPDHRFETLVATTGTVQNGVLQGDLVIKAGGDPFFVWEEAIAVANGLAKQGITQVSGNLIVSDNFVMNFNPDAAASGALFKQGVNASLWNGEAAAQYKTLQPGIPRPALVIEGNVQVLPITAIDSLGANPLLRHRSLQLVDLLHTMNTYSNNVMAELVASGSGGAAAVAKKASDAARFPLEEIQLINGSGLGNENKISPRAVVAMLATIQKRVKPYGLTVADLFPVVGRDRGTLGDRQIPTGSAVKTGTLNDVSSLAGVIPTRDRGAVWFAIINVGTADLQGLHNEQDRLLKQLTQTWGIGAIPDVTPTDRTQTRQLGASDRNEIMPM